MPYITELKGIQSFTIKNNTAVPTSFYRKAVNLALHNNPHIRSIPTKHKFEFTFNRGSTTGVGHEHSIGVGFDNKPDSKPDSSSDYNFSSYLPKSRDSDYEHFHQVHIDVGHGLQNLKNWTPLHHKILANTLSHETYEHAMRGKRATRKGPHAHMKALGYDINPFKNQVNQNNIDRLKAHATKLMKAQS